MFSSGVASWQKTDYLLTALIEFLTALLEYINNLLHRAYQAFRKARHKSMISMYLSRPTHGYATGVSVGKRDKCMAQELRSSKLVNTY